MIRLAYLNSEYPSLSHTFIEREVRELRRLGLQIRTFSVRATGAHRRLGNAHAAAADETCVLQSGLVTMLADVILGSIVSPIRFLRALVKGQRLAPAGIASRVRHLGYVVQGVRLAREMARSGLWHVHVHMANNGAAIAMMACQYDRRLSYSLSIHGSAEFFHVDTWTLGAKVEHALLVRCISHYCRAQIMAWSDPLCWDRLHIVHCGVDTDDYTPPPPRRTGPLRLLTVGRLHSIKGYELLLRACAQLAKEGNAWQLNMVGDGPLMSSLQTLVKSLGIQDRVTFSGAVGQDKIAGHFDRADVLIVSSFMEGIPVVLMEAMAKRLAVIATRVGGIPELVRDGIDGVLIPPGSVEALADAIRPLSLEPTACERFGKSAREHVIAKFSVAQLGRGMRKLFTDKLNLPVPTMMETNDTDRSAIVRASPNLATFMDKSKDDG
jgi:colanic acid/amylovoran biosynthesis glycosyltransferase